MHTVDVSERRGLRQWLPGTSSCKGDRLHSEKADLEIVFPGELGDVSHPAVKVQVKTSSRLALNPDGDGIVYDLDLETYDFLRKTNHGVARALVVIQLDDESDWVDVQQDVTRLKGKGGWLNLFGAPATENTDTVRIRIPSANTLDEEGLMRMIREVGRRRSTPPPSQDVGRW